MSNKPCADQLRKGRYSEANRIYSITTVTKDRMPIFGEFRPARQLIQVIREMAYRQSTETLCFVVMPDHLHWLMQLNEGHELSQVVQTVKSISSKRVGKPIWQKGFYDHAVRKDEDIKSLARYIIANPIRAGLVKDVGQYPPLGCRLAVGARTRGR